MTDEQKFRLIEWMKGVTMAIEAMMPTTGDIIREELKRFEQSLKPDDARTDFRRG